MHIAGVVLQIKGPAFRFTVGRVILPKPSSPCRSYKRKPEKWLPFCSFYARFPLFRGIPWELFCTPGNCEFRIVGVNKTKH